MHSLNPKKWTDGPQALHLYGFFAGRGIIYLCLSIQT